MPPVLTEGSLLGGRYRLLTLLGRGGTAEVYRARDELLERDVAVKVFDLLLTSLNSIDRQRSEMRALAALSDPHLVAVHDARLVTPLPTGAVPEHSYLVMEFVDGTTLAGMLHEGPLTPERLRPIGIAVGRALAAAHAEGLVHRDVKPANVLLARTGAVKLGDFGLARMVASTDATLTSGSMVIGTAAYFSPEQAAGEPVGTPADVYALGLVLLEALTGVREFPGAPMPSAMARLLRDPAVPDGLPAPWPTLLSRMTDRDPAARPTAAEVVRILGEADDSGAVVADGAAAPRRPVPVLVPIPGTGADHPDPVTTAHSSALSSFLHPQSDAARHARRRNSLFAGGGALLAAAVTTAFVIATGTDTPPVDASTVVESGSSGQPTTSSVTSADPGAVSRSVRSTAPRSSGARPGTSPSGADSSAVLAARSARPTTRSAPRRTSAGPAPTTSAPTTSVPTTSVPTTSVPSATVAPVAVTQPATPVRTVQQPPAAQPVAPTRTAPVAEDKKDPRNPKATRVPGHAKPTGGRGKPGKGP